MTEHVLREKQPAAMGCAGAAVHVGYQHVPTSRRAIWRFMRSHSSPPWPSPRFRRRCFKLQKNRAPHPWHVTGAATSAPHSWQLAGIACGRRALKDQGAEPNWGDEGCCNMVWQCAQATRPAVYSNGC